MESSFDNVRRKRGKESDIELVYSYQFKNIHFLTYFFSSQYVKDYDRENPITRHHALIAFSKSRGNRKKKMIREILDVQDSFHNNFFASFY